MQSQGDSRAKVKKKYFPFTSGPSQRPVDPTGGFWGPGYDVIQQTWYMGQ